VALAVTFIVAGACSSDDQRGTAATPTSAPLLDDDIITIPFDEFGTPDLETDVTLFPNSEVVPGAQATLTGEYSSTVTTDAGTGIEADCQYITTDDGDRVNASFADVYIFDGVGYLGPADYVADPSEYPFDPTLTGPGDRVLIQGEVIAVGDDLCAADSAHPDLTVIVSAWSRS
jgi:hypothetical protein